MIKYIIPCLLTLSAQAYTPTTTRECDALEVINGKVSVYHFTEFLFNNHWCYVADGFLGSKDIIIDRGWFPCGLPTKEIH